MVRLYKEAQTLHANNGAWYECVSELPQHVMTSRSHHLRLRLRALPTLQQGPPSVVVPPSVYTMMNLLCYALGINTTCNSHAMHRLQGRLGNCLYQKQSFLFPHIIICKGR